MTRSRHRSDAKTIALPGVYGWVGDPARGNTMNKHFQGLLGSNGGHNSKFGYMGVHVLIGQRKELVTSSTGWEDSL